MYLPVRRAAVHPGGGRGQSGERANAALGQIANKVQAVAEVITGSLPTAAARQDMR
jgi:hypothetical protein